MTHDLEKKNTTRINESVQAYNSTINIKSTVKSYQLELAPYLLSRVHWFIVSNVEMYRQKCFNSVVYVAKTSYQEKCRVSVKGVGSIPVPLVVWTQRKARRERCSEMFVPRCPPRLPSKPTTYLSSGGYYKLVFLKSIFFICHPDNYLVRIKFQ